MSVIFARIALVLVIGAAVLWFAPSFDLGRTSRQSEIDEVVDTLSVITRTTEGLDAHQPIFRRMAVPHRPDERP